MFKKNQCLILVLALLIAAVIPWTSFSQDTQDASQQPVVTSPSSHQYSSEEFSTLTDAEKLDIYLNRPQLLPADFNPAEYKDILHPDSGNTN